MSEITKEELQLFCDMNEINTQMAMRQESDAPRCHMKPMTFDCGEEGDAWWECEACHHTKEVT